MVPMNETNNTQLLQELSQRFEWFAKYDCANASPLYEYLSLHIARDPEILELATHAQKGQPVPNLLLGAVQFLLLQGVEGEQHPLSAFYFSIPLSSSKRADLYPLFRAFCFERWDEIRQLMETHLVQTNEVRRCACLLPAFELVSRRVERRPLSLIEIGASAGLNLLWDRYGYDYGEGGRCGDEHSTVQLLCTLRGEKRPDLPTTFPTVASRIGIDLHPIDVHDAEATLWLRALVWPEHEKRIRLLNNALAIAQQDTPQIVAGDALVVLPEMMAAVPADTTLCLYHSFVINQFAPEARQRLEALFAQEATRRDLYIVSIAWFAGDFPLLRLTAYEGGVRTERLLARCSGHARWMEWVY